MRRAILIAVALSCFVSTEEAAAQSSEMTFTGAQLVTACTTADHEWIGFCNGYLQAAFDATGGRICAPQGHHEEPSIRYRPSSTNEHNRPSETKRLRSHGCSPAQGVPLQLGW